MSTVNNILNKKILECISKDFAISLSRIKQLMRDFHSEMARGLSGKQSSLKMIPTYVDKSCRKERGRFIALDLGGTNLRILELELRGEGKISISAEKRFALQKRHIKGAQAGFFGFLAASVKRFVEENKIDASERIDLGFTFSFPIKQTGIASGILLRWTKDFSVKGIEGKEVVGLLRDALAKKGLKNIRIAALVNDTVGTLVARSYADPSCDIGVILGTGTNACYREKISRITKLKKSKAKKGFMIINIEWGNFSKLKKNSYDIRLDNASVNPGEQVLEKMVSGMYLGEIVRLVVRDLAGKNVLFRGAMQPVLNERWCFKTEYMSIAEADSSAKLSRVAVLLKCFGIKKSSLDDRRLFKEICKIVSARGSSISAAALSAVVTRIDSLLLRKHTVAVDGSLYEKHPGYAQNIKSSLKQVFGSKSRNIRLVLTKDGSGKGAAITAAVAVSQKEGYA